MGAINNLEFATRFTGELDKKFEQKSATGFFLDNNLRSKFVGAKTVIIPDVNFVGLANYDRAGGFTSGAVTVSQESYTMKMDRARSMQIDREDMDETGVANLAGQLMGEYVRTKVVPECDAYVISKLATLAKDRNNVVEGDIAKPIAAFNDLVTNVQEVVGYDEELVAFVTSKIYAQIINSTEITKQITVSDFKQGEISLKVKSINGVALIPVVAERMKTAYDFKTGEVGGFKPAANANETYMMVLPKRAAHLVKKCEKIRIFSPEQNLDADAYKFDYRIYYDVFVKKSQLDSIWVWLSPEINVTTQPTDKDVTVGNISGSLSVTATASAGTLTYQWYQAKDSAGNDAIKVKGATAKTMTIPTNLETGDYFYFVKVIVDGMASITSDIVTVTVS